MGEIREFQRLLEEDYRQAFEHYLQMTRDFAERAGWDQRDELAADQFFTSTQLFGSLQDPDPSKLAEQEESWKRFFLLLAQRFRGRPLGEIEGGLSGEEPSREELRGLYEDMRHALQAGEASTDLLVVADHVLAGYIRLLVVRMMALRGMAGADLSPLRARARPGVAGRREAAAWLRQVQPLIELVRFLDGWPSVSDLERVKQLAADVVALQRTGVGLVLTREIGQALEVLKGIGERTGPVVAWLQAYTHFKLTLGWPASWLTLFDSRVVGLSPREVKGPKLWRGMFIKLSEVPSRRGIELEVGPSRWRLEIRGEGCELHSQGSSQPKSFRLGWPDRSGDESVGFLVELAQDRLHIYAVVGVRLQERVEVPLEGGRVGYENRFRLVRGPGVIEALAVRRPEQETDGVRRRLRGRR